jgi:hypothetical protein
MRCACFDADRSRAAFQTSPQAQQRQYESGVTTLLVVTRSWDRHDGHRAGVIPPPGAARSLRSSAFSRMS